MNGSATLTRLTEDEARTLMEQIRWPNGPYCCKCGSVNVCRLGGKAGAKGQIKCRDCRTKFTIRVGTIFEDSPLPLADWVYCIARMCSSKKSISAHQLHRELGVKYETAWFMVHRVRHAMQDGTIKLSGIIESDETWVGGKPRFKNGYGPLNKRGYTKTTKQPCHTLVARDGKKITRVIADVTAKNLRSNINELVDKSGTLMTDQSRLYRYIGREFKGGHKAVDHSMFEYARKDGSHVNTAESSHALIKRGVYGTYHHVSKVHLQRYLDEFDFRWNNREVNDIERTMQAIKQADGKRLMYQRPDAA